MSWTDDRAHRLLGRCRAGDSEAWGELVDRYSALVMALARRCGLGREDAEDVTQTVFLALYRHLDRIDAAVALPRWLAVCTTRESCRRAGKPTTISLEDIESFREPSVDEETEEELCRSETLIAVKLALNEMGSPCTQLLTMLHSDVEPSYQEISTQLAMPIGSIGPTRSRCLEKLRKTLKSKGLFEVSDTMGGPSL